MKFTPKNISLCGSTMSLRTMLTKSIPCIKSNGNVPKSCRATRANWDSHSRSTCMHLSPSVSTSELTIGEINYGPQEILVEVLEDEVPNGCSVKGKKKNRSSWSSEEKTITRMFFEEEICNSKKLCMKKLKKFFHDHNSILSKRSPHLIRQWILREHDKHLEPLAGQNSSRARWTTSERTIVEEVVNKHSAEDSLPSIPECEFLIEKNPVLQKRNPSSVKAFIYNNPKKRASI